MTNFFGTRQQPYSRSRNGRPIGINHSPTNLRRLGRTYPTENSSKNERDTSREPHHSSFARERVIGDGSRRSPGLRVRTLVHFCHQPSQFPSGQQLFPRLQLRGSAGFTPASQSSSRR